MRPCREQSPHRAQEAPLRPKEAGLSLFQRELAPARWLGDPRSGCRLHLGRPVDDQPMCPPEVLVHGFIQARSPIALPPRRAM